MFRISRSTAACATLLTIAVALAGAPLLAQDEEQQEPTYWRIELWSFKRGTWGDMADGFEKYEKPIWEKLAAESVITEWGMDAAVLHHPGGYTHATWYAADSLAGLSEAGRRYWEMSEEMFPEEEREAYGDAFAAAVEDHSDIILRSLHHRAVDATCENCFYWEGEARVQLDKGEAFTNYYKEYMQPVLEEQLSAGKVYSYGMTVEDVITEPIGGRQIWFNAKDMAALEETRKKLDATWGEMSSEQARARWAGIKEMIEMGSYRSHLSRNLHWATKAK